MTQIFARGLLTDWLLDYTEAGLANAGVNLLIGDAIAPLDGGWSGGQPGEGVFRPYVVVSTMATVANQNDPLGSDNTSWRANYSVRAVGGSRQQVEWAGDRSRLILSDIRRVTLDLEGAWQVQRSRYDTLGAVQRNDSTDPPYWEATDTLALWMEKA